MENNNKKVEVKVSGETKTKISANFIIKAIFLAIAIFAKAIRTINIIDFFILYCVLD